MRKIRLLAVVIALAAAAAAQGPAKTTVSDTLYDPAGGLATGSITVSAPFEFTSADGFVVYQGAVAAGTITNGALSIALVPNTGSTPSGSYYQVRIRTAFGSYTETWIVPSSGAAVKLSAVRTLLPPTPSYVFAFSQIDPPGGCAANQFIEWSGSNWSCNTSAGGMANPMTAANDIIVGGASGAPLRLATGTTSQFFAGGSVWRAIAAGDLPASINANTTGNAATATALAAIPAQCPGGQYSTGVAASGAANCAQVGYSQLSGTPAAYTLPAASAAALGGLFSASAPAGDYVSGLGTDGHLTFLALPSGGVASFNGRTGAVIPQTGDYSYSQISATPTLEYQTVDFGGVALTERPILNLAGSGVTCADNAGAGRTDCTFSGGTGGAGTVTSVGLAAPPWLGVSGSPVTSSGTLTLAAATGLSVHQVLGTGATGTLGLGSLVLADLPALKTLNLADFSTSAPTSNGEIPIWDVGTSKYVPGDPIVSGHDATGTAPSANPVYVAGWDGVDVRPILTDTSGRPIVNINGPVPVTGTFWQATQPVSIAALPTLPAGTNDIGKFDLASALPTGGNTIGNIGNTSFQATQASGGNLHADIDNFPATQQVSAGAGFPTAPTASAAVSDSTSGLTQIVAAVAGKAIYVTGYTLIVNASVTAQWEYGTGSNCATGTTALTGAMSFAANGGAAPGQGNTLFVPAGDALCLNLGGAVQVSGSVSYAQQ